MRIAIIILLLFPFSIYAGSVGTITTFAPGDTLTSADLNGNLSALTTAIDDNDSRITAIGPTLRPALSFYDNGQRIAAVITEDLRNGTITLLSDTGYIEYHQTPRSTLSIGVLFLTTDCTGQAYSHGFGHIPLYLNNGMTAQTNNTGIYARVYKAPGSPEVAISAESILENDTCTTFPFPENGNYQTVFPNDQAVTGMPNIFTGPFTIGF